MTENTELTSFDAVTYESHRGTIPVAGRTSPTQCATYALVKWKEGVRPIDFIFIGANAGQQAFKAASYFFKMLSKDGTAVTFQPMWLLTKIRDDNGEHESKAQGWRVVGPDIPVPASTS